MSTQTPHDYVPSHSRDAERVAVAATGDDVLMAYIAATVATIPPLTDEQRVRVASLLTPSATAKRRV